MKVTEAGSFILICLALEILRVHGAGHLLDTQCVASKAKAKVINGQNAEILFNPWMAIIVERGSMICGGSLIHSREYLN